MKLKIASVILALASAASGAIITLESLQGFDGAGDTGILSPTGNPLTSGNVNVGFFGTLSDTQVLDFANALDYTSLSADFSLIATDDFTGFQAGWATDIPGFVSANNPNFTPTGTFSLYTMIESGGAWALFKHDATLILDPPQPALPNQYYLTLSDGDLLVGTSGDTYIADYSELLGPGYEQTVVGNTIQLVPEPSAALLGALGALGLLRRRRN